MEDKSYQFGIGPRKPALNVQVKPAKGKEAEKHRMSIITRVGRFIDAVLRSKRSTDNKVRKLTAAQEKYLSSGMVYAAKRVSVDIQNLLHETSAR